MNLVQRVYATTGAGEFVSSEVAARRVPSDEYPDLRRNYPLAFGLDALWHCAVWVLLRHPYLLPLLSVEFGTFAARLPDLLNFIPDVRLRLSGMGGGAPTVTAQGLAVVCGSAGGKQVLGGVSGKEEERKAEIAYKVLSLCGLSAQESMFTVLVKKTLPLLCIFYKEDLPGNVGPTEFKHFLGGAESTRILRYIVQAINVSHADYRRKLLMDIRFALKDVGEAVQAHAARVWGPKNDDHLQASSASTGSSICSLGAPPQKIRKLDLGEYAFEFFGAALPPKNSSHVFSQSHLRPIFHTIFPQAASAAPGGAACLVQSSDAPGTPGPVFCVVGEIQIFFIAQRRGPSLKLGAPPGKSAIW